MQRTAACMQKVCRRTNIILYTFYKNLGLEIALYLAISSIRGTISGDNARSIFRKMVIASRNFQWNLRFSIFFSISKWKYFMVPFLVFLSGHKIRPRLPGRIHSGQGGNRVRVAQDGRLRDLAVVGRCAVEIKGVLSNRKLACKGSATCCHSSSDCDS